MARGIPQSLLHPLHWGRRLVDLLGPTGDAARQSLGALVFNSLTSLVAGAFLGSIVDSFEELPGLLLMVPAAIGLRGNIFSTFGNRISTTVHTGTFRPSLRRETVFGQNVLATMSLTVVMSLVLAVVARVVAVAFGVENAVGILELVLISFVGGVLASLVVLGASILLAVMAVRRDWDLDNLVAPSVSTLGDVVTIPCLFLASLLVGTGSWTLLVGGALVVASLGVAVTSVRSHLADFRRIVIESIPVLSVALVLSTLAGVAVEKRLAVFAALPALLVLQPAFVSSAGSLGGILSSRISTNLHLGLVEPTLVPGRPVLEDATLVMGLAIPVYVLNAVGAQAVAALLSQASPGIWWMLTVSLVAGLVTVAFVVALAYYGTIAAWRVDLDPDSVGIPVVTASVDFVGAVSLVAAVVTFGLV
ncbi:MAG: magnesium transporter [Microthrixaceae bacterium]|nr:magnesium transporter [Microthrixaceae bacterium]